MPRKKISRPLPADDAVNPLDYIAFADAEHPAMTDAEFDAHLERMQRHCVDCGGAIEYDRDGIQCQACALAEVARAHPGDVLSIFAATADELVAMVLALPAAVELRITLPGDAEVMIHRHRSYVYGPTDKAVYDFGVIIGDDIQEFYSPCGVHWYTPARCERRVRALYRLALMGDRHVD